MAVKTSWSSGDVLTAADLTDTFAGKLAKTDGNIVQVVRATDGTTRTTTSNTYSDVTGMTVTITPRFNNSSILVLATFLLYVNSGGADRRGTVIITDASNNALSGSQFGGNGNLTASVDSQRYSMLLGYSTPATTSATTYKLRWRAESASTSVEMTNGINTGQIYAIEVTA